MHQRSGHTIIAMVVLAVAAASSANAQIDMISVDIQATKQYINNVPCGPSPYTIELVVIEEGSMTGGSFVLPSGGPPIPLSYDCDDLEWYAQVDCGLASAPTGTFTLNIDHSTGTVTFDVEFDVPEPTGFPFVTSPQPGAVDVPLDPEFVWEDASSFGDFLNAEIESIKLEDEIQYIDFKDSAETEWKPAIVLPGASRHVYDIEIINVDFDTEFRDGGTDDFLYAQGFDWENDIEFTTCQVCAIPGAYSTGVDDESRKLPVGVGDSHYELPFKQGPAVVIPQNGSWVSPPPGTQWIGPPGGNAAAPPEIYRYSLSVDLANFNPDTVVIAGSVAADNAVTIDVNFKDSGFVHPVSDAAFSSLEPFALSGLFTEGLNSIGFNVVNTSNLPSPTGLLVADVVSSGETTTGTNGAAQDLYYALRDLDTMVETVFRDSGGTPQAVFSLPVFYDGINSIGVDAHHNLYVLARWPDPIVGCVLFRNGIVVQDFVKEPLEMAIGPDGSAYVMTVEGKTPEVYTLYRWRDGLTWVDTTVDLTQCAEIDGFDVDRRGNLYTSGESLLGGATVNLRWNCNLHWPLEQVCCEDFATEVAAAPNGDVYVIAQGEPDACPSGDSAVFRLSQEVLEVVHRESNSMGEMETGLAVDRYGNVWIGTRGRPDDGVSEIWRNNVIIKSVTGDIVDLTVARTEWKDVGHSLHSGLSSPVLSGIGSLQKNTQVQLTLTDGPSSMPAFLIVGFSELAFPGFYGGTLVPDPSTPGFVVVTQTDGLGGVFLQGQWPTLVPPGFEMFLQYWVQDAFGIYGFSASNALRVTAP